MMKQTNMIQATVFSNLLLASFRPVTLIGFALGARVIFKCLQCLAEKEGINGKIVDNLSLFVPFLQWFNVYMFLISV